MVKLTEGCFSSIADRNALTASTLGIMLNMTRPHICLDLEVFL